MKLCKTWKNSKSVFYKNGFLESVSVLKPSPKN